MSATDPVAQNEYNLAMHERIIALGAVPNIDDLEDPAACNILHRQLIFLLGAGGGGGPGAGGLIAATSIEPGLPGAVSAFLFGPAYSGPALGAFGAGAFPLLQPVLPVGGPFLSLQMPPGATGAFTIPAAAEAPAGWIDAITLSPGFGTSYTIDIATNAIGAAGDTIVPFAITAGALTLTGVISIGVIVP